MAAPWKSFNEIYQDLTAPPERQYGGGTAGGLITTDAAPTSELTAPAGPEAGAGPQQQTQAQPAPPDLRYKPQDTAVAGAPYSGSGLLAPLRRGAGEQQQGLQSVYGEFQQQAGPSRTYQGTGAEEKLRTAIEEGRGLDEAKGLAGATYTGPRTLSAEGLAKLESGQEALRSRASALQAGQIGTQALLGEAVPGLTRGQRRFEAQLLHKDPEYIKQQRQAILEAQGATDLYGQRQREAEAFGTQRAGEEDEIRRLTQEYLGGRRGGIETSLTGKMTAAEKQQSDLAALNAKFQETGSVADLQALVPDAERLNSPTRKLVDDARAKAAEISAGFEDIKDVPLMEPRINSHGREVFGLPEEWWEKNQKKYTPEQLTQIKARAQERQTALEAAGFAPDTLASAEGGQYAAVAPLYFNEGIDPYASPDLRLPEYTAFDPGSEVTRGAVASPEERERLNRIFEILDQPDSRMAQEDPVRLASMMAEIGAYLDNEKATLEARKDMLTEREEAWLGEVNSARKRYKKKAKAKSLAKAVGWVSGANIAGDANLLKGVTPGIGKLLGGIM